jgi:hypothetical protein
MWTAKKNIVWRNKDNMLVLLDTTTGHYYTVNQTGARLWRDLLERKMSVEQVVEGLRQDFADGPDKSVIRQDCARLIEEWRSENLIEETPEAEPA